MENRWEKLRQRAYWETLCEVRQVLNRTFLVKSAFGLGVHQMVVIIAIIEFLTFNIAIRDTGWRVHMLRPCWLQKDKDKYSYFQGGLLSPTWKFSNLFDAFSVKQTHQCTFIHFLWMWLCVFKMVLCEIRQISLMIVSSDYNLLEPHSLAIVTDRQTIGPPVHWVVNLSKYVVDFTYSRPFANNRLFL